MPRVRYLDEFAAREIVEELTYHLFPGTPAFRLNGEQGRTRLLSALNQIRWSRYRTLQEKAAALHYFLNRNHPYVDGNKRFAVAAMEVFLYQNMAALMATPDEVTEFALSVAKGDLDLDGSFDFLRRRTVRAEWEPKTFEHWLSRLTPDELDVVVNAYDTSESNIPSRWKRVHDGFGVLVGAR